MLQFFILCPSIVSLSPSVVTVHWISPPPPLSLLKSVLIEITPPQEADHELVAVRWWCHSISDLSQDQPPSTPKVEFRYTSYYLHFVVKRRHRLHAVISQLFEATNCVTAERIKRTSRTPLKESFKRWDTEETEKWATVNIYCSWIENYCISSFLFEYKLRRISLSIWSSKALSPDLTPLCIPHSHTGSGKSFMCDSGHQPGDERGAGLNTRRVGPYINSCLALYQLYESQVVISPNSVFRRTQ